MSRNRVLRTPSAVVLLSILICWGCSGSRMALQHPVDFDAVAALGDSIDALLDDPALDQTHTEIKVVSLATDEVLYERDSHSLLHPASNQKLLTTVAALNYLGPSYRFDTVMAADSGSVSDSVVTGDLYLSGHGDPDFTSDDLHGMVDELASLGIRAISGDIVCDDSYFDSLSVGVGWMWDDGPVGGYYSPISAIAMNSNTVEITVMPGDSVGSQVRTRLFPNTAYVTVSNSAETVAESDTSTQLEVRRDRFANKIYVEGGLRLGSRRNRFLVDVIAPGLYVGTVLGEQLQEAGISFSGRIRLGQTADSAAHLVVHRSAPLSFAVQHTNKASDNLSAEMLLKATGAGVYGPPGSADKGLAAIRETLATIGIDTASFSVVDGSGVSRYDLLTPDILIELLRYAYRNPRFQAEFVASLPIAGMDGTLEDRMQGTPAEGLLRAKTGSLAGISSLSGYTTTPDGEPLAFSMIFGHFVGESGPIRGVQDRIGALLSSFRRRPPTEQVHIRSSTTE